MKMKRVALSLSMILVLFSACQKNVAPRPGAVDLFDSQAYDTLIVAKASLEAAKVSFSAGKLPGAKPVINAAIDAYNIAQASWHLYHDSRAASHRDKLAADIAALTRAVASIFGPSTAPAPTGKVQ